MRKLADYVVKLQERDVEQAKRIEELQREAELAKKMYGPPVLTPIGKDIKKTNQSYEAITQFQPSNNSNVNGYEFKATIIGGDANIESFGGSVKHHAMIGGDGSISMNKKTATTFFKPLAGNPTIRITVSAACIIELSGSHLDRTWILDIK